MGRIERYAMNGVLVIVGLLCMLYVLHLIIDVRIEVIADYETFHDFAIVVNKEYEKSNNTVNYVPAGVTMIPVVVNHEAKYEVYVLYEGKEYCIDDKRLYERANLGNEVVVTVKKGYINSNHVKTEILSAY